MTLVVALGALATTADARAQEAPRLLPETLLFADGFEIGSCESWPESTCTCAGGNEPALWFEDADEDTFGNTAVPRLACAQPAGFVSVDGDCDDTNPLVYPGAPEVCNGDDDDCNGLVDDDAVDALTWYRDADEDTYGDPGDTLLACAQPAGYVADDSDCDDTDPGVNPGAVDLPDTQFVDANCDGIDGDIARAAFVAPGGVDDGLCSLAAPCGTIPHALAVVAPDPSRDHVYLRAGNHAGPVDLPTGVGVWGGYDVAWVRADRSVPGHLAAIQGGLHAGSGLYLAVRAVSVSAEMADLQLTGPNAVGQAGGNGRSTEVVRSQSSNLTLRRITFAQGNGVPGATGTAGTAASATPAASGGEGEDGLEALFVCNTYRPLGGPAGVNAACSTGTGGGAGGRGGSMDTSCTGIGGTCSGSDCNATVGLPGAASSSGTSPGGSGGGLCRSAPPEAGGGGAVADGPGGPGASVGGALVAGAWYGNAGGTGGLGAHGRGGGGGGGAGGCDTGTDDRGPGGGGGGAGGCRAPAAGGGGGGGGGSFGVLAIGGSLVVSDSLFLRGQGGAGGTGGAGASGQPGGGGGFGGAQTTDTFTGGAGGFGGRGGHSGGGGGGAGGRVCGILTLSGATLTSVGNVFTGGAAGPGGFGGPSPGNAGQTGAAGALATLCN